jgi:hypothetical protein
MSDSDSAAARRAILCRCAADRFFLPRPTAHGAGPVTFFASPKKVTKERRPHGSGLRCAPAALALRVISGPCAKLARSRLRRATGSDSAPGTAPLLPRTAAASPSGTTASAGEDRGGQTQSCDMSSVGRCRCPRRRRAAQGAREGLRACLSERPQGASLQARPRPRAAQGSRRSRPPSRARLLLVTSLGKTREVTGRAALKRTVEGRKPSRAAATVAAAHEL